MLPVALAKKKLVYSKNGPLLHELTAAEAQEMGRFVAVMGTLVNEEVEARADRRQAAADAGRPEVSPWTSRGMVPPTTPPGTLGHAPPAWPRRLGERIQRPRRCRPTPSHPSPRPRPRRRPPQQQR